MLFRSLGNKSFVGHKLEDFTPEEDLLYTSIAVLQIFDRMGNRKNMARNRMRYLVDEIRYAKKSCKKLKLEDLGYSCSDLENQTISRIDTIDN